MIEPPSRKFVQRHSQLTPASMRMQSPWSVPTTVVLSASNSSLCHVSRSPVESPLTPVSTTVSVTACSITVIFVTVAAVDTLTSEITSATAATLAAASMILVFPRIPPPSSDELGHPRAPMARRANRGRVANPVIGQPRTGSEPPRSVFVVDGILLATLDVGANLLVHGLVDARVLVRGEEPVPGIERPPATIGRAHPLPRRDVRRAFDSWNR